jgi:hypothetical protein
MYKLKKSPTLGRIFRDLEDFWAAKDLEHTITGQDEIMKVDSVQFVLRKRGREADLAGSRARRFRGPTVHFVTP